MLPNNESPPVDTNRIVAVRQTIDLQDKRLVRYGSGVQERFAKLADNVLRTVVMLESERIDELISEIRSIIEKFNAETPDRGFFRALHLAKKGQLSKKKIAETSKALDERGRELDGAHMKALVNLGALKGFRELNSEYHEELECYILAGRQKLETVRDVELKSLRQKVEEMAMPEDVAACNFLQDRLETLEERLCSLETTRTMSSQMAVQLQLMQSSNEQLVQKIEGGNSLISAWKQSAALDAEK